MTQRSQQTDFEQPDLDIPLKTVCFIIFKAHEFDAKDVVTDEGDSSNPTDDGDMSVLEDHGNDPVEEELVSLISELTVDEQIDLVALMWLGRGDYTSADWKSVRGEAAAAHNEHTAEYLCGEPLLGDYLSEGLALFDYSCADYEEEHV